MDKVLKIRRSFMNEIRAYCNMFVDMCDHCYRQTCDCFMADYIRRAKNLIIAIDNIRDAEEERYYQANPMQEIMDKVLIAMRQAGCPVRAREIVLPGVRRNKKSIAINNLMRRGKIEMTIERGERIYSACVCGDKEKQNRNKGDRQ